MLKAVDYLAQHVDIIEFGFSMVSVSCCIFLVQATMAEPYPHKMLQRLALGFLGLVLFWNALADYDPWQLLEERFRPSGVIVQVAIAVHLFVFAYRAETLRGKRKLRSSRHLEQPPSA